jgi:MoxR-like ATPase
VASPLVSAMILGGVCILDEGNRMAEKSWASLAPLLDHRRYVDSILIGARIAAHPDFRFVTTMNDDNSVFQIPEYIESRLSPQIELDASNEEVIKNILDSQFPKHESNLNITLVKFISSCQLEGEFVSPREALMVMKFAQKIIHTQPLLKGEEALKEAWRLVTHLEVPSLSDDTLSTSRRGPLRPV